MPAKPREKLQTSTMIVKNPVRLPVDQYPQEYQWYGWHRKYHLGPNNIVMSLAHSAR